MARKANGKTPPSLDPDEIASRSFDSARRGYEPDQVRAFLEVLAEQYRVMGTRLAVLERRAQEAEERAVEASRIDEDRLADALGEQVKEIYDAARRAATEMREQAAEQAAAAVRDSQQRAKRVDAESEKRLAARTRDAEQQAASIVERAGKRKVQVDAQVEEIKRTAAEQSEALVAEAKEQGLQLIQEAKVVRRRILADLAKRRKALATQIEQLRVGREQLLTSLEQVREAANEATVGLEGALPAARAAAERAARHAESAAELSVEQLEVMIDSARDAGMVEGRPVDSDENVRAGRSRAGAETDPGADEGGEQPHAAETESQAPAQPDVAQGKGAAPSDGDAEPERPASARRRRRRRGPSVDEIDPEDTAPAPEEGRKSSAVRVFRLGADEGDATDGGRPDDQVAAGAETGTTAEDTAETAENTAETAEADVEVPAVAVESEPEPEAEGEVAVPAAAGPSVSADESPTREVDGEGREVITNLFARIRADNETGSGRDTDTATGATKGSSRRPGKDASKSTKSSSKRAGKDSTKDAATEMVLPLTAADAPGSGAATERDQAANADDAAAAIVERRDEALAALERGLGRAVKRVLADEQNAILDAVRPKKRQKRTELDDILPASDEHAMRYAVAAKAELRAAVQAGAELAGGETADVGVDDLAAAMALSVCRPLRERVDQAFASSENPDALASELRGLYREWKTDRVDQCAREFSAEAFNRGVRMVAAEPSADLVAPAEGRSALTAR